MDIAQLIKLKGQLTRYYSKMHANMKQCAKYYNQEFTFKKWQSIESYKPATARNKVDVATDHIVAIGPTVVVNPWGKSAEVKEVAGRLERWGKAELARMERATSVNPRRAIIKQGILYGMSCLKGPLFVATEMPGRPKLLGLSAEKRKEAEKEYETKRGQVYPFRCRAVNPQNLLIDPAMDNPQFVIEFYKRKAMTIKALWPQWNQGNIDDFTDVDWWEYWTPTEYCFMAGTSAQGSGPVTDGIEENWLGFMPYQVGFSGLGEEAPDGDPAYRAVGLVYPILSGIKAETRSKTAMLAFLEAAAYGRPTINKQADGSLKLGVAPGEIQVIPDHFNYRNELPPNVNPDVYRVQAMIEADINAATFSAVMEGERPAGVSSGYYGAILVGQARVRLEGNVNAAENMLGKYLTNYGPLIRDVVQERVTIAGYIDNSISSETVGPDDFKSNPQFFVRFEGKTPEEKDRRFRLGIEALVANALSWETVAKDFFGVDPVDERQKILVQEVLKDPNIRAAMASAAVKAFGMEKYLEMVKEAQQVPAGQPEEGRLPVSTGRKLQRLGPPGMPTELGSEAEMETWPT